MLLWFNAFCFVLNGWLAASSLHDGYFDSFVVSMVACSICAGFTVLEFKKAVTRGGN